ncbi:helix-turn-helix domain-containing protein [Salinispora arenicola]|uniref:Helix-turn-helix protein n=1 Tax=Salinispora arenicola TaxID=168697 RepID=A0A542XP28_SALAC|nr:helix-turn-helix transcriptional regulator [Salinispora arenicola]MCN0154426.1 helix-turn-helix transcriptional regulator [Salinispora arenicola]TQL37611.1 helix-turn-helix protein [Salinispora arenicola]GIM87901.1 transcriptional regulator [Salinispora arenicola]
MEPTHDPMPPAGRIKLYRRRRGLTQEVCAQLKGVSVGAWRKWESGERSVNSLADWIDIARILNVRDLYKLTGHPLGVMPDDPAEHESVPPLRAAMTAYAPDVDQLSSVAELRSAVRLAWTTWYQSRQRYTYTSPVLPGLIHASRAAVASLDGNERRHAQQVAADLYLLVRAFAKKVGAQDLAVIAADRALTAAYEADDPAYRASAAWNMGQVLSNRGHTEDSVDMCRQAIADLQRTADDDPVRLAALGGLHLLLSIQYARLRDERRTLDVLDRADELAARTGETEHHFIFFGPTNTAIHRAAATLELSRPGEAARIAERVDVGRSPSIERRHSHFTHLARAYASKRDDYAAIHMLQRAHRESPEESSLNLLMRATVRELLTRETATSRNELRSLAELVGVV